LRFGASRSEDLRLDEVGKAPAPRESRPSRHLRGYEFTIYVDYSIVRESESMLPAYAAPEIQPLAPDHSGGSASDALPDLPSGYRA
jgi:hypothetical protein